MRSFVYRSNDGMEIQLSVPGELVGSITPPTFIEIAHHPMRHIKRFVYQGEAPQP